MSGRLRYGYGFNYGFAYGNPSLDLTGPVAWLADITPRPKTPSSTETTRRFADKAVTVGGNAYQPLLRIAQAPRFNRTLIADFGEIELLTNPNLTQADQTSGLIPFERFEGALCVLSQYHLGLDRSIVVLRGRLQELEETDNGFRFRVVSELDPAQTQLHDRLYAQLCTWRFRRGPCGYLDSGFSFTEHLAERTATSAALQSITDSTLSMTADEHKDRYVLLTAGTGRGQLRRIRTNTATTLFVWTPWSTVPDTTTKFKVFSFIAGASKPLWTAAGSVVLAVLTNPGSRSVTSSSLKMVADEHKDDILDVSGTLRRIKTNDATSITIADDEPDLFGGINVPTRIRFRRCPKDFVSCEQRARTEAFNGFLTLVPLVFGAAPGGPPLFPPFDPGDFGGGGGFAP